VLPSQRGRARRGAARSGVRYASQSVAVARHGTGDENGEGVCSQWSRAGCDLVGVGITSKSGERGRRIRRREMMGGG
jgi:hypothetical protein